MEEKGSGRESEGEGKRSRSERGEWKEVEGPATLQYFEPEPPLVTCTTQNAQWRSQSGANGAAANSGLPGTTI